MSAQIVFIMLYHVQIFDKHIDVYSVLPAWHGPRTGLTWTVNKQGGIQRTSPEPTQTQRCYSKMIMTLSYKHDKKETEPIWLSPVFAIFQAPHVRLYA